MGAYDGIKSSQPTIFATDEECRRDYLMKIFLPQMPVICAHCEFMNWEENAKAALKGINACVDAVIESEKKEGVGTMNKFIKEITMSAAFDKRDPNPSKNYGIHGVEIRFVLKGELGATQFVIYTDWQLPHVQKEGKSMSKILPDRIQPMGANIGYHSPKPMYEGQSAMGQCNILGCECYYDGSSLQADEFIPEFLAGGSDAVWKKLEEVYHSRFIDKQD